MKLRLLALVSAMLFASSFAHAESYSHREPFKWSTPFNADGAITLENVNGSIEVRTWDKNEVLVEGEKSAKTEEELKLIEQTINTSPTAVTIKVRLPKRPGGWFIGSNIRAAVHYKLTVPARAVLRKIDTVNGSVTLDGLQGPVKAGSVNGRINATNLGADAKLETVNGSITASFTTLTAQQKLSFDTVNGGITIRLPKDAGATVHASVVNGHVDCDLPLQLAGGRISRKKINGTIGDGRATLKAETVNGSIAIKAP